MIQLNLALALNQALRHALSADPEVLLMGEDVGATGGVFRITDGLLSEFGPERVIDTPVSESGIVGAGLGMAIAGLRPVIELQFLGFAYPAYDQIVSHVGRVRNRSRHRFTAPLVIRIPYGAGIGAAEHHSESTEALFMHTPGVKVVIPGTPTDGAGLLLSAIADPDPVIFLEPIRSYRSVREEVEDDWLPEAVPLGQAAVRRVGADVSLVTYGAMLPEVLTTADQLATQEVSAEVIDLRSLVPLDLEAVLASVEKTGRAVIVTEGHRSCGVGAELIALIQERSLYSLQAPIQRVSGWDTVVPLRGNEDYYVPGSERIIAGVRRTLG